jgi:hypothetical protein
MGWLPYLEAESVLAGLGFCERQDFFWLEDAKLLRWTPALVPRLNRLDDAAQKAFLDGRIPPGLFSGLGFVGDASAEKFLSRMPADKVVDYCRVHLSRDSAWSKSMVRACGVKRSKKCKVAKGDITMGVNHMPHLLVDSWHIEDGIHVDSQSYVIRWAATAKRIDRVGMSYTLGPRLLAQAKRKHDRRFFNALRRATQQGKRSGKTPPEVDWDKLRGKKTKGMKLKELSLFLVDYWCGWPLPYSNLPPLCLFDGKARSEFCAILFTLDNDEKFRNTIRQAVSELGLWRRLKQPKVRDVALNGNFIRFSR